ncbi:adrenocortical dysplasia protein homolog isoform X3 [Apus apus]|uniref:adrenocortical dysplasia protein homolog isoform X3 n=1 Tax=Apus apus TaxID=8895 RepID=UPI0021F89E47|nr:adrenocortical dysplasia protein homolog isoform X3 [Apus apus]
MTLQALQPSWQSWEETPLVNLLLPALGSVARRSLALKNAPSSEPSISQLIDAIAENQLDILKENAEQCLDLGMPQDTPVAVKDKVPVTPWEAERKKERGEDIFMVPAHALVTTPVEEVVTCEASKADTSEAAPGKSEEDRTTLGHMRVTSQVSRESCLVRITCSHIAFYPDAGSTHLLLGLRRGAAESSALSETSEGSLDNPWNQLPPISLTLNSSDEKTCQDDLSQQTKEDVAADSNTPDLLEPCSQDSAEGLPQGEPLQTSSPSLLLPHSNTSPVETSTTQVEPSSRAPSPAEGLQVSGAPQAPLPSFSPVFPVLPSSRAPALPGGMPQREQADSSGTAFPPDPLKHGPAPARTQGGDAVGAKRKLVGGDEVLTTLPEEQRPQGAPERDAGRRPELLSTWGAKKSRREETGLQRGEELEEEEQPSPASGPSSRPQQRRALPPYVKEKPSQYRYKAPSPELCRQIRSIRISKAMLKWACWILTDREVDS